MKTCDGNVSKEDFLAFWQKFSDLFEEIDQNKDQTIVVIEITNFLKGKLPISLFFICISRTSAETQPEKGGRQHYDLREPNLQRPRY